MCDGIDKTGYTQSPLPQCPTVSPSVGAGLCARPFILRERKPLPYGMDICLGCRGGSPLPPVIFVPRCRDGRPRPSADLPPRSIYGAIIKPRVVATPDPRVTFGGKSHQNRWGHCKSKRLEPPHPRCRLHRAGIGGFCYAFAVQRRFAKRPVRSAAEETG